MNKFQMPETRGGATPPRKAPGRRDFFGAQHSTAKLLEQRGLDALQSQLTRGSAAEDASTRGLALYAAPTKDAREGLATQIGLQPGPPGNS